MDRISIIAIVICFVVLGLWVFVLMPKYYPVKPLTAAETNKTTVTMTVTNPSPGSTGTPPSLEAAPTQPGPIVKTDVPEELLSLTNENARYTFTTHGGGLKLVELLKYPENVPTRREKQLLTHKVATLNTFSPAPTLALLDGGAVEGDGVFKLTKTSQGVLAEKTLTNGLTIVKEFNLSTNYLVSASVQLINTSTESLSLPAQEWVVGTATPMGPQDTGQAVGVLWYDGSKTTEAGASGYFASGGCRQRVAPLEYRGGASNVVWVAVHNQFFALVAMRQQPGRQVIIRKMDLPRPTGEDARLVATNAPIPQGYEAAMVYPEITLAPKQSFTNQIYVYAGPKEFQTLARIGDRFNNDVDKVMSFNWAGFVSKALLLSMNWLHRTLHMSYGWAIVGITVIIKMVFWPLTKASTRSMKRMQTLQPQMKAIQEKYKADPVKMNRKVMEFMKEHKVSPLGGCLPMLLQIPVFFGFFSMINSAIELRGAHFFWVSDLSQPDTLFVIPGLDFIPYFGIQGVGLPFNLLPLIMGGTMLWQAHLTPPSPGMDPAQAKMMRYMPLMFMVFLYRYSAGLTLYWTVQNILTIIQTKLTKTVPETKPAQVPVRSAVLAPQKKKK